MNNKGVPVQVLVDTSVATSIMRNESSDLCSWLSKIRTPYVRPVLPGANNVLIQPDGQCMDHVFIDGIRHHFEMFVQHMCVHKIM